MTDPKDLDGGNTPVGSHIDLATLGLAEVAYVREAEVDGVPGYSIHAANGEAIGFAPGMEAAMAAIMTNDMDVAALN